MAIQLVASGVAAGVVAIALRLDGQRWRSVAETAALTAAAIAYLLLPPLLAWAAATTASTRR